VEIRVPLDLLIVGRIVEVPGGSARAGIFDLNWILRLLGGSFPDRQAYHQAGTENQWQITSFCSHGSTPARSPARPDRGLDYFGLVNSNFTLEILT
jgi:hypothetical protein